MILYVLRYWPTLTETFVHDELRAVARALPVELAAFDPRGDPHVEPAPVPVHAQPHRWRWLRALPALAWEWLRAPAMLSLRVLWLTTIVRRSSRVHVHFVGEAAVWARRACRRAGVPYSVTVHAVDLFKPHPEIAAVLRDAIQVVTISEHNRALLRERYGIAAALIRCGVSVAPSDAPSDALQAPPRAAPPVILGVGRWVPKKGLDTLALAATRLGRDAVVRLISDAPPLAGVEVCGLLPRAEVARALAAATVFALPCRTAPDGDQDGIPVALLEAMAAGLPVVTTAVSGIPEIVDEAVGWVVAPDDSDALAAALRAALDDPDEAARRGARGRARLVERGFDAASTHAAMVALLSG